MEKKRHGVLMCLSTALRGSDFCRLRTLCYYFYETRKLVGILVLLEHVEGAGLCRYVVHSKPPIYYPIHLFVYSVFCRYSIVWKYGHVTFVVRTNDISKGTAYPFKRYD